MRTLIVDDSNQIIEGVRQELRHDSHFEVLYALDPLAARRHLRESQVDVVVADVLYEHLMRAFTNRMRDKQISLRTDRTFLLSGLATLHDAAALSPPPGMVLWAAGMERRELHMLFAYQELNVRVYCSKGPTPRGLADLKDAVLAAAEGRPYSDPMLDPFLPRENAPMIRDALFGKELWRAIWRALALGVHRHDHIAKLIDYRPKSVRNVMSEMAHRLSELDPGIDPDGDPSTVLSTYAVSNWQFFLDDTVMRVFAPKIAAGISPEWPP